MSHPATVTILDSKGLLMAALNQAGAVLSMLSSFCFQSILDGLDMSVFCVLNLFVLLRDTQEIFTLKY